MGGTIIGQEEEGEEEALAPELLAREGVGRGKGDEEGDEHVRDDDGEGDPEEARDVVVVRRVFIPFGREVWEAAARIPALRQRVEDDGQEDAEHDGDVDRDGDEEQDAGNPGFAAHFAHPFPDHRGALVHPAPPGEHEGDDQELDRRHDHRDGRGGVEVEFLEGPSGRPLSR